jgi:hypothetical protein
MNDTSPEKKLKLTLSRETLKKLSERPEPAADRDAAGSHSNTLICTCCGTTR